MHAGPVHPPQRLSDSGGHLEQRPGPEAALREHRHVLWPRHPAPAAAFRERQRPRHDQEGGGREHLPQRHGRAVVHRDLRAG